MMTRNKAKRRACLLGGLVPDLNRRGYIPGLCLGQVALVPDPFRQSVARLGRAPGLWESIDVVVPGRDPIRGVAPDHFRLPIQVDREADIIRHHRKGRNLEKRKIVPLRDQADAIDGVRHRPPHLAAALDREVNPTRDRTVVLREHH
jgi:hypothetical protein